MRYSLAPPKPLRLASMILFPHYFLIVPLHIYSPSPKGSLILLCSLQSDCLRASLQTHTHTHPTEELAVASPCYSHSVNLGAWHALAPAGLSSPVLPSPPGSRAHCKAMWSVGRTQIWEPGRCRFDSQRCHSLAVCPWASHLTSLSLKIFISK